MESDLKKMLIAADAGDAAAQLAYARLHFQFAEGKTNFKSDFNPGQYAIFEHLDVKPSNGLYMTEAERNYAIAFAWYCKAAESGDPDAIYELGLCYQEGKGTEPSPEKAQEFLMKAAELGQVQAQFCVGLQNLKENIVAYGINVKPDPEKAVYWLKKAAAQQNHFAMYYLGLCYENGYGVGRDYAEAVRLYRETTECRYPHAESFFELARCYEAGYGVDKDIARMISLCRKAAEAGDGRGAFKLGECYELGIGVEKNLKLAIKWYNTAAEEGNEDAINALFRLGKSFLRW